MSIEDTTKKKTRGTSLFLISLLLLLYICCCQSLATSIQGNVVDQSTLPHQPQSQHMQNIINISVKENLQPGTLVANITVPDGFPTIPVGSNQLLHSITGGDGIGRFSVDIKGRVHTKTVLDYEIGSMYWLTVTTVSRGTIDNSFTTVININVLNDESDDLPILEEPFYLVKLLENSATVKQQLVQVRASLQYPPNAAIQTTLAFNNQPTLEYSLLDNMTDFYIDPMSGIVSLRATRPLNINHTSYVLDVRITKRVSSRESSPPTLVPQTKVPIIVEILDINNNEPDPYINPWRCSAHSNIDINTPICTVPVSDADTGPNSQFTFTISSDDEFSEQNFRIDNRTGTIYRKNSSRELAKDTDYMFYISIVDHGVPFLESSVKILIKIIDAASVTTSSIPKFNNIYDTEFTIQENSKVGDTITLLQVNDTDGDKVLTHIVSGNDDGQFTMTAGALIIAKTPQFTKPKINKLTIMATDGSYKIYQNLTIIVPGQTRSVPNKLFYHNITIEESQTIKANDSSALLDISTDAYDLKSAKFTIYSVSSEDAWTAFSVDECCGIIRLNRQLDHEMCKSYEIVVQIEDIRYPKEHFRSFSSVTIKVIDSNDWRPSFLSMEYNVRVPETAPISTPIIQLQAIDLDIGRNAELSYYITSGNDKDLFGINETIGTLFVKRELLDLSSDKNSEFILQVMAKDNGQVEQLNGTTEVHIVVTVPKIIPPKFPKKVYQLKLREDLPAESAILKVQASASESHGQSLYYTILEGNDDNTFVLNNNSGELSLLRGLDHEVKSHYELIVAADIVSPPTRALMERKTHAECTINITIIDVNDNKPAFNAIQYSAHISRSAKSGDPILDASGSPLRLNARDLDSGINGVVNFGITTSSIRDFLTVDQTAKTINVTKSLDSQPNEITFSISAHDMGSPSLIGESATVVVQILSPPTKPPRVISSPSSPNSVFQPKPPTTTSPTTLTPTSVIMQESPRRTDFSSSPIATTSAPFVNYNTTHIVKDPTTPPNSNMPKKDSPYPNGELSYEIPRSRDHQIPTRPRQRPLALTGSSYIRYNVAKPNFDHLSLKFRTYHNQFVLLYSNNSRGHYVLDAQDSFLRFRFDLSGGGGGSGLIQLRSIMINDGRWHDLTLDRKGISFILTVDSIYTASGAAPLAPPSMSQEFEPVFQYYFGAEADLANALGTSYKTPKRFGFAGCLDEITIDSTRLSISNEGVYPPDLLLVNIELGCHQVPLPPLTKPLETEIDFAKIYILFYSLAASALAIFICCLCCMCLCCCRRRSRDSKRRRKNEVLLRHHHHTSSNAYMEDSFTRSVNSRHSLRVAHTHTPPITRAHHSKYGAGDTVSLSAINERKHKPNKPIPPIPDEDERGNCDDNYENFSTVTAGVFGPGHPEFLNELRKLKPDYTRVSTRVPPTPKKQTSASTMNSIITTSDNSKLIKSPRPIKNSSNANLERIRHSNNNISENIPTRINKSNNMGSKSNIRGSSSPSANNNNTIIHNDSNNSLIDQVSRRQRPILVNGHHRREHSGDAFSSSVNQPSNTTEDPDYDEVDSELDSGDSDDSGSELPSETRFLTFTRKKKRKKDKLNGGPQPHPRHHIDSDTRANEDTDNGMSTDPVDEEIDENQHRSDRAANRNSIETNGQTNGNQLRPDQDSEEDDDDDDDDESEEEDMEEGVYEINGESPGDSNKHRKENGHSDSTSENSSSDDNLDENERKHLNVGRVNGRRSDPNHIDQRHRRHSQQTNQNSNGHNYQQQSRHHSVGRSNHGHNRSVSNGSGTTSHKESDDL